MTHNFIKYLPKLTIFCALILSTNVLLFANSNKLIRSADAANQVECDTTGWFPTEFGLTDHHIFWYDGYYYLVSIYVPLEDNNLLAQTKFAYARSIDLCAWEDLSPILDSGANGVWAAIWSPYVLIDDGTYYLYFTGVSNQLTQQISLATSTDPSDPNSWQVQENVVFEPDHPGMVWEDGMFADCRDPTVIKVENVYYLYYAGRDEAGSIIGLATAPTPSGPWFDWGTIVAPEAKATLESPTIAQYGNAYYLFHNRGFEGEHYQIGPSPGGPWGSPIQISPGWAHEVWQNIAGEWYTSYLTDYTVTIATLWWDPFFEPAHPTIITNSMFFPVIYNSP